MIVVVTSIIKDKDLLTDNHDFTGSDLRVCFTDRNWDTKKWELRKAHHFEFSNPRRCVVMHHFLAHLWFPMADWIIFMGGQMRLDASPQDLVNLVGKADVGIFKHPNRDCTYEEAKVVLSKGHLEANLIQEQMDFYRTVLFPERYGLVATGITVRYNNTWTNKFFESCWAFMSRWSCVDQLVFDFCRWLHRESPYFPDIHYFDGNIFGGNGLVHVEAHNK